MENEIEEKKEQQASGQLDERVAALSLEDRNRVVDTPWVFMDFLGSLFSFGIVLAHILHPPPYPATPWAIQTAALSCFVCPVGMLVLKSDYLRWRGVLGATARLLFVHASTGLNYLMVNTGSIGWVAFTWHLLRGACSVAQLWATVGYRLPLRQHIPLVLFTAANVLGKIPAKCPAPPPGSPAPPLLRYLGWLRLGTKLQKGPVAVPESELFFSQSKAQFQAVGRVLDLPFSVYFNDRHLGDIHPLSDTALCVSVLVWAHLAVAVVGSTLIAYGLDYSATGARRERGQSWLRQPSAGPGQGARRWGPGGRFEPAVAGPVQARMARLWEGVPKLTAWDVGGAAFCVLSILWPMLRWACLEWA